MFLETPSIMKYLIFFNFLPPTGMTNMKKKNVNNSMN